MVNMLRARIAVIGDGTVGKTALTQMAMSGDVQFPKNYMMTLGVDLLVKEIPVEGTDTSVELYIHDVGGQEVYVKNAGDYLNQMDAFMVVYDIGQKMTFEGVHKWVEKIRAINPNIPGVLVANKADLADKAEVSESQGETYAQKHHLAFIQTSALRAVNTLAPFRHIAYEFVKRRYDDFTQHIHSCVSHR